MESLETIAGKLGLESKDLEKYGENKAKIKVWPGRDDFSPRGKLIMVTAMNPTPAGEGKTTTAIGLADALARLGHRAVVTLREPSLGPVFGLKGGATGGGKAKVIPSDDINLHFTGDIHAVTAAHNLLAAMVDNRLHFDGACGLLDCRKVTWKRVLDMDDRVLREVIVGIGGPLRGIARESGFEITAASEVMAILCLSIDLIELKERLGKIVVGYTPDDRPVLAQELKAHGAMAALLREAIKPNLVQTLEGTPALIHGGPFANIAHGTNSVIATRLGLSRADYVVTETGFGADLGAEKFFNIVVRTGHIPPPACCVLVATIRALKYHGGVTLENLEQPNLEALERGFENLKHHGTILRSFGLPFVVALNRFSADKQEEITHFASLCYQSGFRFALSEVYEKGGEGGLILAEEVMRAIKEDQANFNFLYPLDLSLEEKIQIIAQKVYGAAEVAMEGKTRRKLQKMEKDGFKNLPVCIAKTQYSLSDDEELKGRPHGFKLIVTDVSLSAGAGFVVVLCGDIMTMPGLPRHPAAERIDITPEGEIIGLN
ncbi:MAG: formate--tetrahydrofolate ligase [Candidatus Aminicenantes bacterium]|nr:formate--tetrahydrofolate ligase [Candidatus Aminicenantes bacterium]